MRALKRMEGDGFRVLEQPAVEISQLNTSGLQSVKYPRQTPHVIDEAEAVADACEAFLKGVVIVDAFGAEHQDRREWRQKMHTKYGDAFTKLYNRNKLRLNNLAWVHLALETFAKGLTVFGVRSKKAEAVQALAAKLPNLGNYNSLTIEERLELVRTFDDICKSLFDIISKQELPEETPPNQ